QHPRMDLRAEVHTGVLIAEDLVLTSSRIVPRGTLPSEVTVTQPYNSSSDVVRTGRFINHSNYYPAAIIQVSAPFSGIPLTALDNRSASSLVGVELHCYSYANSPSDLRRIVQRVLRTVGGNKVEALDVWGVWGTIEDSDSGSPCVDLNTGTLVSFSSGSSASGNQQYLIQSMRSWIDGMRHLAQVRTSGRAYGPVAIYNRPNSSNSRMCLDIPWGGPFNHMSVNQYPCHGGTNQQYWLDYGPNYRYAVLVSESSGRCLDLPGGSTSAGTNIQQYSCHGGENQQWDMRIAGSGSGILLKPVKALNRGIDLCLSVEGGASTASRPTEQDHCLNSNNNDQRWYFNWNP
ncbi:MAG: RICIN domain-containing protein, partial [Myxococcota bacterium]